MAKRTFHQVIPVYGLPRDPPPHGLSFKAIVLDDPKYAVTWFAKSSTEPIIGDIPMSGGRVLGGTIPAQVATGIK